MAFRVPNFNITCNINQPPTLGIPGIPTGPFRLPNQACQLTYGHRVNVVSTGGTGTAGVLTMSMNLLLPARTDVRGPQCAGFFDMVEVPAGSSRWYQVVFVDDIGRGFSNEHRTAAIFAFASPAPIP